jgi:hypothetical protein
LSLSFLIAIYSIFICLFAGTVGDSYIALKNEKSERELAGASVTIGSKLSPPFFFFFISS